VPEGWRTDQSVRFSAFLRVRVEGVVLKLEIMLFEVIITPRFSDFTINIKNDAISRGVDSLVSEET
jgi:hypothetical protein